MWVKTVGDLLQNIITVVEHCGSYMGYFHRAKHSPVPFSKFRTFLTKINQISKTNNLKDKSHFSQCDFNPNSVPIDTKQMININSLFNGKYGRVVKSSRKNISRLQEIG